MWPITDQNGSQMGRRTSKGLVSIDKDKERIRLRWRYQSKRYSLNLFRFTTANLHQAKKIALRIEQDLLTDNFDATLYRYKPQAMLVQKKASQLYEHFEFWVKEYRHRDCDKHVDYWAARNMLKRWGEITIHQVVQKFNAEAINARTYNRRLTLLNGFFQWLVKQEIERINPLADVQPKIVKKQPNPKRRPFTVEEIGKILFAVKNDTHCPKSSRYKHSHYYPFLYFIFKTGVRNAEAVGLRLSHIDQAKSVIRIAEVMARTLIGTNSNARIRKETKNEKVREIPLTPDLWEILLPLLNGKKKDDLVFNSPTGLAIDDRMFQRRVFKPVLKALNIEERDLYACRHTFGSRCIESGLTPVMTAFLMGNNPETALRNYTHQLSLPNVLPQL